MNFGWKCVTDTREHTNVCARPVLHNKNQATILLDFNSTFQHVFMVMH